MDVQQKKGRKKERVYCAFAPGRTPQPIELKEETDVIVQQIIFQILCRLYQESQFLLIEVESGRIGSGVQVYVINSRQSAFVNFDQPYLNKNFIFIASTFHVGDFQNSSCSSFISLRVLLISHVHRLLVSSESSCVDRSKLVVHHFFLCIQHSSYRTRQILGLRRIAHTSI